MDLYKGFSDLFFMGLACFSTVLSNTRNALILLYDLGLVLSTVILVFSLLIYLFLACFRTIPYSIRRHRVLLTKSMERKFSKDMIQILRRKFEGKLLRPTHPLSIRVSVIATDIIEAMRREWKLRRDDINWQILVLRDSAFRAQGYIGGKIIISTGMLQRFPSDRQIAAVLGHEVTTVTIQVLRSLHQALAIPFMPCCKRKEIEADYIGLFLMAAAGYDPRIAPKVCEELGKIEGNRRFLQNLCSTHPTGKKRAELLSQSHVMEKALAIYLNNSWRLDFQL